MKLARRAAPIVCVLAFGCAGSSGASRVSDATYYAPPPRPVPPPRASQWPGAVFLPVSLPWPWPTASHPLDIEAVKARMRSSTLGPKPIELANGVLAAVESTWPRLTGSPFAIRKSGARTNGALPDAVDLRSSNLDGPVKSQEMVGVCWSFALSSVMDNALRRQGQGDVVAPMHLISSGAWDSLHEKGKTAAIISETAWPYVPAKACKLTSPDDAWCGAAYHVAPGSWRQDASLSAEVENADAHGSHAVSKFQTIDPPTFEAIADELASGHEVYGAFRIDDDAWSRPRGDVIPDYGSESRGPHATTIIGYRMNGPRGRELLIKNSWGSDWGAGGYAWLSERSLTAHGDDFFTVEVASTPVPQTAPPPHTSPLPVPAVAFPIPALPGVLVADACAAGQARDVITRVCTSPCGSGAPRLAGLCAP